MTCTQEAEMLPQCTKSSVLYENVCGKCNGGAAAKKELKEVKDGSLYVGESSRSIYERSKEHWSDYRGGLEKSHIKRHQDLSHNGEEPHFVMRTVAFYRTALSRQIGEAVRIRRRGGAMSILNSKSEFDRCHIPRLVMEEEDEEEIRAREQKEIEESRAAVDEQATEWGAKTIKLRKEDDRRSWQRMKTTQKKHGSQEDGVKESREPKRKKLKYELIGEQWGETEEQGDMSSTHTPTEAPTVIKLPVKAGKQARITDFLPGTTCSPKPSVGQGEGVHRTDYSIVEQSGDDENSRGRENITINMNQDINGTEQNNIITAQGATAMVDNVMTSSGEVDNLRVCKADKRGHCTMHGVLMKKLKLSSQKWGLLSKGRGYGYKTVKVTKYICRVKDITPLLTSESEQERFREDLASTCISDSGERRKQGIDDQQGKF